MGWVVMKFGGTSVSSVDNWMHIADELRARMDEGHRPLMVCSAFSGVSNLLETLVAAAVAGEHAEVLEALRTRHAEHAESMGVELSVISENLDALARLAQGLHLVGESSARLHARIMAHGELMSTTLAAAWLRSQQIDTGWLDARDLLQSVPQSLETDAKRYLSAICNAERDEAIIALLDARPEAVLLTQGFVARDPEGHTVLLGRGGSDTTGAYLAARLGAERLEIWTDVAGMYTANPRLIPQARLLKVLTYDEAQEIASTGAKVLHPRCIAPVRAHRIPLHIRCTPRPDAEHTIIQATPLDDAARVKSVSAKSGITLISMNTDGMWQKVGFLADVFAVFKGHGLSVDLVSTSEMNVTVSLDTASNLLDQSAIQRLLVDLAPHCRARAIESCAAVSLVGQKIRAIVHKLGPALEAFEEQKIHLVSQAASDLNLTFVVEADQSERMVRRLHALLFPTEGEVDWLGPPWSGPTESGTEAPRWWVARRDDLLALAEETPAYVYDASSVREACAALTSVGALSRVLFAIKANPHPAILRIVADAGMGFECVSPGEVERALEVCGDPSRILFTPNFAPREEYAEALANGIRVTLDNLHPLVAWPEVFAGAEVFLRVDPGQGRGHHQYVRTAGTQSKFGVWPSELDEVRKRCEDAGATVIGLHAHTGSGIRTPDNWRDTALFLADVADDFTDVRVLNLGGGLGVPERPGQTPLDLDGVDASLAELRQARPELELWMEPGRYVVALAGVLLARVTQVKQKGSMTYVGVNTGMNSLIRPALYGAWHDIVNLSRLDAPKTWTANVVGPICESGDTLGYERHLPPTEEGDVLLIDTAGAYGRVMSSFYNLREPAREIVLEES